MRLLAITRRTQPKEALHNRPDFADLARHHALCIICPVPWTAMMHAVVGGLASDTSEWSDGIQVLYPTYYATPGLQPHRDGISFERSVRSAVRGLMRQQRPDAILSSWSYPDGWAAVRLGQQTGLPVVLHVSGSNGPLPDGRGGARIVQELCGAACSSRAWRRTLTSPTGFERATCLRFPVTSRASQSCSGKRLSAACRL